jgi:hypothetical protein
VCYYLGNVNLSKVSKAYKCNLLAIGGDVVEKFRPMGLSGWCLRGGGVHVQTCEIAIFRTYQLQFEHFPSIHNVIKSFLPSLKASQHLSGVV